MSVLEIAGRVEEKAKKDLARGRYEGWKRFASPGSAPTLPGLREAIAARISTVGELAAEQTAGFQGGRYRALGVDWPSGPSWRDFPAEIWRLDPATGKTWPGAETYCFDIPYRHEKELGDVKYVWEFNRLQFLQSLAFHVLATGDADAIATIEAAISSWCDHNPPYKGIGWNSGIELALRAISLLLVSTVCGERLAPAVVAKLRAALAAHLFWLARYPSRFSSANNHLVAEAAAEFLIGTAMPEARNAPQIADHARAVLEAECLKQILPDGIGAEQSPTYGAFTAEFVLLCATVAKASGRPFRPEVDQRLGAFAEAIAWFVDEQGRTPGIGDDDEGRVIASGREEPQYAASVAAAINSHLGTVDTALPALSPELRDAVFGGTAQASPAPQGVRTFQAGGYTVVRETRDGHRLQLIFDHAPLGYLSIAAHGHADALSVVLAIDGRPVLVDPGTYLYHSGGAWRSWFRGTLAHNTLALADADQSIISGSFNWSRKAVARLDGVTHGETWRLEGSHDGYVSRFGPRHRRVITPEPGGLRILDLLQPASELAATVTFQFPIGASAEITGRGARITLEGGAAFELAFEADGDVAVACGGDLRVCGWVSNNFGEKTPAPAVRWRGRVPAQGLATTLRHS